MNAWRENAKCKGMNQSIFFPKKFDELHCRTARAICAGCPVKEQCLGEALRVEGNDDGIFAGTTPSQRNRMRRGRRDPRACAHCGEMFVPRVNVGAVPVTCSPLCRYERLCAQKRAQQQRADAGKPDQRVRSHGLISTYRDGCRCAVCRKAAAAARKRERLVADDYKRVKSVVAVEEPAGIVAKVSYPSETMVA